MPRPHVVYILRCADGSLYAGKTTDLRARLLRHAEGTACMFTRTRRPVTLVWSEPRAGFDSAARREIQLKGWTRAKKEALIAGRWDQLRSLSLSRSTPA
jgi:predicted GIY-YIG superfamily endonuclease